MMGIVDDDRIGIGNVYPVFNNGCREKYIIVIIDKTFDNLLQLIGFHLPVTDSNAAVRYIFVDKMSYFG